MVLGDPGSSFLSSLTPESQEPLGLGSLADSVLISWHCPRGGSESPCPQPLACLSHTHVTRVLLTAWPGRTPGESPGEGGGERGGGGGREGEEHLLPDPLTSFPQN